ncbi:hypothetical protein GCM10009765_09200 [Fodinicola feengrottensis]|uniref:PH domain-containing protein n=1 Tax=Fodinicola feengrottensis TaxID=435914 RepID=A0ABN2FY40_9ACTN
MAHLNEVPLGVGAVTTARPRAWLLWISPLLAVPAAGLLLMNAQKDHWQFAPASLALPFVALLAAGLLALLPFAVWRLRRGAWLQGSVLVVRGFRTRRVDLATATDIRTDLHFNRLSRVSRAVPVLLVRHTGGWVRMQLATDDGRLLLADQLACLAGVLLRSPAPNAAAVAGRLCQAAHRQAVAGRIGAAPVPQTPIAA